MATTTQQPAGRIMLRNVRLSFPVLWKPKKINETDAGEPKFSVNLLLPPDHPQVAEIKAKMRAVGVEKWQAKADAILKTAEKVGKYWALQDGETKTYDGYEGNLYVRASTDAGSRPTVVDQLREPVGENDGKVYSGCFVNASIDLWAMDNKWGKGVNAQIRGVQKLRDGDAFAAGRPADADEFDEVTDGTDADDIA